MQCLRGLALSIKKNRPPKVGSFYLDYLDNNDTIFYGFQKVLLKKETITRKVKP